MLITNFASGELSQNLNGRVDIQQYYQGAARIENFEIIPTGGIKRRVGTQRLAELSGNSRIIPFIVDKNSVFVFEIGLLPTPTRTLESLEETGDEGEYALYNNEIYKMISSTWTKIAPGVIKVWHRTVSDTYTILQTIDNVPWANLKAIKELQFAQNYNTIIFVHKDYKPYIIEMTANVFSASEMEFDLIPDVELDDDFDYIMVPMGNFPQKETTTDGHGRFTYDKLIDGVTTSYTQDFAQNIKEFWCLKDGKLYKWDATEWVVYGADPEIDSDLFKTINKYPSCVAFFNNRLFFASSGLKPQMVWASAAPDNYGTRYNDFATYKKYVTVNKTVMDADLHIFTCDLDKSAIDTTNHRTTFKNVTQDFTVDGTLKAAITDYFVTSGILAVGTKVVSVTQNTITVDTDKVAVVWDEGETEKTNFVMSIQLWRSADSVTAENYEYMVVANNITTADCSLFFELASDQNDAIKFLSSNRFLAVGTESSIWSVDPGINALSINAVMQGRYGSDDIQGQAVETATVYFAQGKKGIREFYYDGQSEAFRTNNIALLADHILRESAVSDFDYMTNPYSRLLLVRQNGTLAEMLYDKTNGIMAWSRITQSVGKIRNCAVTRGDDENDFIFLVVEDNEHFYLEKLDYGKEVYLDSWKLYDATEEDPTAGYSDGAILFNETTGQTCPYDDIPDDFINEGDVVYIGYKFISYIKSMPVVGRDPSKRLRIVKLVVRFLESYKPVMKCTDLPDEKFTSISTVPYSGIAKVNYPGETDHDVHFELEASEPYPVNILSVDAQTA
jgi:hypothetical protein